MAKWTSKSVGGRTTIILFLLLFFLPRFSNAVEIRIRGKAFIDVRVNHASTFLQVSGTLSDDLERGLRERSLNIRVLRDQQILSRTIVKTKEKGRFFFRKEFPPGEYQVQVEFLGNQHLDGDAAQWSTTLQSADVKIATMAPEFVHNPQKLIFHASASAGRVPIIGTLELSINDERVGEIKLDRIGRGGLDIAKFLKPGMNAVKVSLPGSEFRDGVAETRSIRNAKNLYIVAKSGEGLNRLRRGVSVKGVVSDGLGGIENLPVSLHLAKKGSQIKITKHVRTGSGGRFSSFFFADKLSDGDWEVEIKVRPRGQGQSKILPLIKWSTKTERVVLNVFALIAMLGALILLFSLLRARFKDRRKKRKVKLDKKRKRELAFVINEEMVPVSMPSSTPGLQKNNKKIAGVLVNPWKGARKRSVGIEDAQIEIASGEKSLQLLSDEKGRFEAELEKGEYQIIVKKHGFVTGKHTFMIPHNGVLSDFKIELIPVPLKIRRLYEAISEEKSGKANWGYQTPQEMEKILKLAWPSMDLCEDGIERKKLRESLRRIIAAEGEGEIKSQDLLAAVSSIVEESYFSGKMYSEETWFFMRNLALRLVAEMSS